jgi:hypothetical protein
MFIFKTGFQNIAQVDLYLKIFLPQLPECRDHTEVYATMTGLKIGFKE